MQLEKSSVVIEVTGTDIEYFDSWMWIVVRVSNNSASSVWSQSMPV